MRAAWWILGVKSLLAAISDGTGGWDQVADNEEKETSSKQSDKDKHG